MAPIFALECVVARFRNQASPLVSVERRIHLGHRVMLDADLASLYGVPTKALGQAVKRNRARFPADFMFRLTPQEFMSLRSQIVTSNKRGGRRYAPLAFTEQGVAMLSTVLKSVRAIHVNIAIMRAFVRLREIIGSHKDRDAFDCRLGKCRDWQGYTHPHLFPYRNG